jgi:hypothetical protein
MMHEPSHTLCIVKQTIEPPTTCLSTNIGLEANCRFDIPQDVPTPMGMSHNAFSHFLSWYQLYMPILPYLEKVLAFPMIYFGFLKNPILFLECQSYIQLPYL